MRAFGRLQESKGKVIGQRVWRHGIILSISSCLEGLMQLADPSSPYGKDEVGMEPEMGFLISD